MNADRRKRLATIIEELNALRDEEELAKENLPESFQYGEQGEKMEQACDSMQEAIDALEGIE